MGNGMIIYQSKYGATKKYVDWLVEETGFDCVSAKSADIHKVNKYDIIILAGGIYASGIAGLSFLRKNIELLKMKKVAVLCVGASPFEEEAFVQVYERNFKDALQGIPCYYGRGAWNEEAMSFKDRTLCRLLQKAVAKQDPATYEPWQKALMCTVGRTCDWTDRRYLQPLIEWINS
ncbi:MAG: flavodoxin domain-containing protein [Oscillospiraceae bacterium]|jgi:menaquinone-dependent protoporphyrinogen IX oxidase